MKKSIKERMENASLGELLPGFDKDAEWVRLSANLQAHKRRPLITWARAAAILLMVAATGVIALLALKDRNYTDALSLNSSGETYNWVADVAPAMPAMPDKEGPATSEARVITATSNDETSPGNIEKPAIPGNPPLNTPHPAPVSNEYRRSKEFVCNGTPCPLEICIVQTINCKNQKPSAIATCNTLEPDQARQLNYKATDGAGAHCKVTIKEITIRRITTGETIVLNAHSKPSTAEELFNCITGSEKCDLLAGIFEADCNNQQKSHSLKIDKSFGNLIVQ